MKNKSFKILFILLGSFLLLIACSGEADEGNNSEETYEIDVNNWTSSSHHYAYNAWEPWEEMVEEKTDGRVTVNVHHGSSLGESDSVYQDVEGGLYDVSLVVANYFYDTDFFPYTIGNLPFALDGP